MENQLRVSIQTSGSYHQFLAEHGVENTVKFAKECGFEAFDYSMCETLSPNLLYKGEVSDYYDQSVEKIIELHAPFKKALKENDITIPLMHAPFPTYSLGKDNINDYLIMAIEKCCAVAEYLECPALVVHPYTNKDLEFQHKVNIDMYSKLIPAAKKHGVTICLENMWNRRDGGAIVDSACSDPNEAVDYIDTLNDMAGEELFAFCFDVGHANLTGKNMRNTLRTLGKRVKVLHIHDTDKVEDKHTLPYAYTGSKGLSVTDYVGFLAGLRDIGYEGDVNFEIGNAFKAFPAPTHPALCGLVASIGRYFESEITPKQV